MSLLNKIFFYLSIYNFIFPIRLRFIPYSEYILYVFAFIYLFFRAKFFIRLISNNKFFIIIGAFITLITISLLSTAIFQSDDFLGSFAYFKIIFAIFFSIIINIWGLEIFGHEYENKIFDIFIFLSLIVSLSCLMDFFNPSFKQYLIKIFDYTGKIDEEGFRARGFASGGSSLSFGLYTSLVYGFISLKNSNNRKKFFLIITSLIIIYFSLIFIGRAGFFMASLFLILYGIYNIINSKSALIKTIIFSFLIFFLGDFILNSLSEDQQRFVFSYSLEPINKFLIYGVISSNSTDHIIQNMIYLPDFIHLVIGAGYWRYPINNYYLSDIGYYKILMSTGIIGIVIFFSTYFYLLKSFYKRFFKKGKLLILFLIFSFFVFELKEEVFTQNYAFKMLILLITFSIVFKKNKYVS